MKYTKFIIILCSFLFLSNFKSSKDYEFDYIIEYKNKLSNDNSVFYLTNSKDNSYWAVLRGKDSQTLKISFYKHNSLRIHTEIDSKVFHSNSTILIEKPKAHFKQTIRVRKNDKFEIQSDTIMNSKTCKRYIFKSLEVHKKKLEVQYSIQPNTNFHLPILTVGESYKNWEKVKTIPNGIFNEMFFLDENKNIVETHLSLVNYQSYNKTIKVKF